MCASQTVDTDVLVVSDKPVVSLDPDVSVCAGQIMAGIIAPIRRFSVCKPNPLVKNRFQPECRHL